MRIVLDVALEGRPRAFFSCGGAPALSSRGRVEVVGRVVADGRPSIFA